MLLLGQNGGNHWLEEGVRNRVGTHRTKSMEVESTVLYSVPKDARILIHSATQHTCWKGENNSSERLAGPGVPRGCLRGCSVPAVPAEGQGQRQ